MTEATPRPWRIQIVGKSADVIDALNDTVISFDPDDLDFWNLIVRAVNERDELIGALSAFIGRVMNAQIDMSTGKTKAQVDAALTEALRAARATLAKVKAG